MACVNVLPKIEVTTSGGTTEAKASVGRHSIVEINPTTWTVLPAVSLPNRVNLAIQNKTGERVKVKFSTPSTFEGMELEDNEERSYNDIDPALIIYAKSEFNTVYLDIEELGTV